MLHTVGKFSPVLALNFLCGRVEWGGGGYLRKVLLYSLGWSQNWNFPASVSPGWVCWCVSMYLLFISLLGSHCGQDCILSSAVRVLNGMLLFR